MSNKVNLGGTATKIGHHDNENSQYMIKNDHGGSKYWRAQAPIKVAGGMLSGTGRTYMYMAPWLALAPGLCLTMVVYGINVLGDAMRDLLDPRMRGSR